MSDRPALTTTEAYDLWARSYDAHDNPLVAQSELPLAELTPVLSGKRVLELGCGTGRLAPAILAAGATEYVGVDGSSGMLERARTLQDPRARWLRAELSALPPSLIDFDLVLLCLVLEHFEDPFSVLSAAAKALGPAGQLVALELHAELAQRGIGAHFEHQGQTIRLASYPHEASELRTACTQAGLTPTRTTDWFPDAHAVTRSPKLARYRGTPVLLELRACRS